MCGVQYIRKLVGLTLGWYQVAFVSTNTYSEYTLCPWELAGFCDGCQCFVILVTSLSGQITRVQVFSGTHQSN